ncbi:MAG: hypothetical protein ACJA0I_001731 [Gammaproteobacteria bacterium]|jgi:hypothetical protein
MFEGMVRHIRLPQILKSSFSELLTGRSELLEKVVYATVANNEYRLSGSIKSGGREN